jgi:hypothetical protein
MIDSSRCLAVRNRRTISLKSRSPSKTDGFHFVALMLILHASQMFAHKTAIPNVCLRFMARQLQTLRYRALPQRRAPCQRLKMCN